MSNAQPTQPQPRLTEPERPAPILARASQHISGLARQQELMLVNLRLGFDECKRQGNKVGEAEYAEAIEMAEALRFGFTSGANALKAKAKG